MFIKTSHIFVFSCQCPHFKRDFPSVLQTLLISVWVPFMYSTKFKHICKLGSEGFCLVHDKNSFNLNDSVLAK